MSSGDEDGHHGQSEHEHDGKRRKVQRACDVCRRKKIRCDGASMAGNRCSNCIAYSFDCTYVEAAKKRGPPKGYVESLENRLEKMEKLLTKLCPNADFTSELGGSFDRDAWLNRSGTMPRSASSRTSPSPSAAGPFAGGSALPASSAPDTEDGLDPSDDEMVPSMLIENMKRIRLDPMHPRFIGKSSGFRLLKTALDMKSDYSGEARAASIEESKERFLRSVTRARGEFWQPKPYELAMFEESRPTYMFPPAELVASLVALYFTHTNPYLPLLHRPTFERSVREGLHLREDGFGATLLLVCAIASRYSEDDRVFLDGVGSPLSRTHSAGWKWFNQVQVVRKPLLAPPCLYDLQAYALSVIFLHGSSSPQACWTMVGIGIRLAQDVGAHRRKVYGPELTVEDELWKRACWVLVALDRAICCTLGRPCALQDEDFDLDLPAECDDEYWENDDPALAFKQPEGKPSSVSYFICRIKLNQVLAFALRTIYSINKSKVLLGFVGQQWEQHIVAELDSALNKWIDSVPDHLRWDPNREHQLFFNQSVILYGEYYNLQIIIHRPFIPSPRKPSALSFPSLAICTNAARSSSHIIDIARKRGDAAVLPSLMIPSFTAGIVLLLNIWGGKRSGASSDPEKEMSDVHKCMAALKSCEERWHAAGRLWDILRDLASAGELPLPQYSPGPTHKRERDSDEPIPGPAAHASAGAMEPPGAMEPRTIAGSRRATAARESNLYALPLHSADLGRLPLHQPADAPSPFAAWYSSAPAAAPGDTSAMAAFEMDSLAYEQMMAGLPPVEQQGAGAGVGAAGYGAYQAPQGMGVMDTSDTIAMWSTAPSGFEWDDWGTYITTATQQGQYQNGR